MAIALILTHYLENFPIDPALTADSGLDYENQLSPTLEQGQLLVDYSRLITNLNTDGRHAPEADRIIPIEELAPTDDTRQPFQVEREPHHASRCLPHPPGADMPPPPPLDPDPIPVANEGVGSVESSVAKEKASEGSLAPNAAAAPTGKRRGRPPGSKNKPKNK